jgi:hypothetical protein
MSWLTNHLSNAFDRSRNIPILIYLSSSDLYALSIKSAIAVLVDFPLQKPCCVLVFMPWLFRGDTSLFLRFFQLFSKTHNEWNWSIIPYFCITSFLI